MDEFLSGRISWPGITHPDDVPRLEIEDGYFEVDIAGNFTFFNNSMCRMIGYSRDEITSMNYRQYMDEENAKEVFQAFNYVYRSEKPSKGFDWKLIRKDGSDCFLETSVSLIKDLSRVSRRRW